ncbi:unnamed protein product [Caretta caretta]
MFFPSSGGGAESSVHPRHVQGGQGPHSYDSSTIPSTNTSSTEERPAFQGQTGHDAAPVALHSTPHSGTTPFGTTRVTEIRVVFGLRAGVIGLKAEPALLSAPIKAGGGTAVPHGALATVMAGVGAVVLLDLMGIPSSPGPWLQISVGHLGKAGSPDTLYGL